MWQQEQDLACPGCSQPRDLVWVFSPDEQRAKEQAVDSHMRLCVACAARDFRTSQHDGPRHGLHPVVFRTDG